MNTATIQPPYHQWMLNAYLQCPEALRLTMLEGAKPAFRHYAQVRGSAVHATIRRLHEENAWANVGDVFREEWDLPHALPGPLVNADAKRLAKELESWADALRQYAERERDMAVLFCELPIRGFVRSRGGREYAVQGTVDQVRAVDGGFDLYEFKTSATPPTLATLERNVQLSLYSWCLHAGEVMVNGSWGDVRGVLPGSLRSIVCYHLGHLIPYRRAGRRSDGSVYAAGDLRGDPCYRLTKSAAQLEQGAHTIARIIAAIRAGGFYWNPSSLYGGCDGCAVKYACGKGLESNQSLEPDRLQAA